MFIKSVTDCVTSDWFTTPFTGINIVSYITLTSLILIYLDIFFLTSFLKECSDLEGPVTIFNKENKNILLTIRYLICK